MPATRMGLLVEASSRKGKKLLLIGSNLYIDDICVAGIGEHGRHSRLELGLTSALLNDD